MAKQSQNQQQQPEFTVAVVLPQHLWGKVHSMRTVNDNKMVHLKLIQTTLPQQQLAEIAPTVAACALKTTPFTLTFDTFISEPSVNDASSVQVRLLPSAESAAYMCTLNSELEKALDIKAGARKYAPFLHIANVPKAQAVAFITKLQTNFEPIIAHVHDIYFIAREAKKDFVIRKSFPLGSSPIKNKNNSNNNTSTNTNDNNTIITNNVPKPAKKAVVEEKVKEINHHAKENNTGMYVIEPCFKFSAGEWFPISRADANTKTTSKQFSIATFNVLFDFHDADKIHTHLRVPAIFTLLHSVDADTIALEEVTAPFLDDLLAQDWVRKNYYISSLEVGYYGQVILSRFPFKCCEILLGKPLKKNFQHTAKKAVVAEFVLNGRSTHVSAVHLTSDKSENAVEKRKLQLQQIDNFMITRGTENFIVGDFNFGDNGENILPFGYDDVWTELRPNEAGFTFDVTNNNLAKITTNRNVDNRLDRILYGSNLWVPNSVSLFGCEPIANVDGADIFPSDHYGVLSVFKCATRLDIPNFEFSAKTEADPLYAYLKEKNQLPENSYSQLRTQVLRFLEKAMEDVFGDEGWKMHLIGSSRFGIDTTGSDLDIVVVGNMPRPQFYDFTTKVLMSQSSVTNFRAITSNSTVPIVKLTVGGINIDIQYCCFPQGSKLPRNMLDIDNLVLFRLDGASLVAINGVRDSEMISRAVKDFESFQLLVLFIKLWAKERNIYSSSIGFFGGFPLAILAARLCHNFPQLSPSQLVSQFFIEYGTWDLRTTPMSLPGVTFPPLDPKKHAIPIFTPSKPIKVIVRNGTQTTREIIARELERAYQISRNGKEREALWNEFIAPADISKYGTNLVINANTETAQDFAQWTTFVESRMVDIILQLERTLRNRDPAPAIRPCDRKYLCPKTPSNRAYFFVAVDVPREKCPEFAQLFASNLDFSGYSRGASEGMLISVDITSDVSQIVNEGEEVARSKKMVKRENPTIGEFHSVRAEGGLIIQIPQAVAAAEEEHIVPSDPDFVAENNYAQAKDKKNKQIKYGGEFSEKKIRMRTSVEVFNRINWDASLPKSEFIIGYEDRFEGIMEAPFLEFDLESIPLHRIRIFKRNGVIVWSRHDRIDALFKY